MPYDPKNARSSLSGHTDEKRLTNALCITSLLVLGTLHLVGCKDSGDGTEAARSYDQRCDLGSCFVSAGGNEKNVARHTFVIKNPTHEEMSLKSVGFSCGCTSIAIKEFSIAPDCSGEVEMLVDLSGHSGNVTEYALLSTGLRQIPNIRLSLSAIAIQRIEVEDMPAMPFLVAPEEVPSIRFTVITRRQLNEPHTALSVSLVPQRIDPTEVNCNSVSVAQSDDILEEKSEVSISLPPKLIYGALPGHVHRLVRIEAGSSRLDHLIEIGLALPIAVSPKDVFLRRTSRRFHEKVVRLKSDEAFRVVRCDAASASISADALSDEPSDEHEVRIQIPNTASVEILKGSNGAEQTFVTVYTDHPGQSMIEIPVSILD